jgi:hypothetical protein
VHAPAADVLSLKLGHEVDAGLVLREDDFHWVLGSNSTIEQVVSNLNSVPNKVLQLQFDEQDTMRTHKFVVEPFPDSAYQKGFLRRLEHMPGFWCCRQPNGPLGKGGTPYAPMILYRGIEHRGR